MRDNITPHRLLTYYRRDFITADGVPVEYQLNTDLADEIIQWLELNQKVEKEFRASPQNLAIDLETEEDIDHSNAIREMLQGKPLHDQGIWFSELAKVNTQGDTEPCGTTCCVAGYIGMVKGVLANNTVMEMNPDAAIMPSQVNHMGFSWNDWCEAHCWTVKKEMYETGLPWAWLGAFYLGIPVAACDDLFSASNTATELIEMLSAMKQAWPAGTDKKDGN